MSRCEVTVPSRQVRSEWREGEEQLVDSPRVFSTRTIHSAFTDLIKGGKQ